MIARKRRIVRAKSMGVSAPVSGIMKKSEMEALRDAATVTPGGRKDTHPTHITSLAELMEIAVGGDGSLRARKVRSDKRAGTRVDTRRGRKREYRDFIDDYEHVLHQHGINMIDLMKASREYAHGTRDAYHRLANAVYRYWTSRPMSARQVVWVDPASGYTEDSCPKFSAVEGMKLVRNGLAGSVRVYSRQQLVEAREWKQRMLSLAPEERVASPIMPGDIRLAWERGEGLD